MLCGCGSETIENDLGMRLASPSKKYVLGASVLSKQNEPGQIALRLQNSAGDLLDVFRTNVPPKGRWALGWAPNEDVLVLQYDLGTTVYIVSKTEKIQTMECPQEKYGAVGRQLMKLKYPETRDEEAEPKDALDTK